MTGSRQRPLLFLDVDGPLIPFGLHWKTRALVDWAAGRPFAWVDDEITDADRTWVAAHHRGAALLHRVDSRHGLTDADYATLGEWLDEIEASGRGPRGLAR